ncbi:MAG TPA: G/U mismatch-specific DNA glycosylase [Luteibacter sp.]|uniref:G/U mismatch-specific DNA glycosylase n=1 Tax=Luteibacter sp. TaxID=1886636 RepID=UPI002BB53690|nr:G/U mismatch-specific DNA glycosylase [Luteibacter sp.]HVI53655.1 G/U mismatch-specific DNA glycosylase [Luteibacter sp.]
MSDGLPDIVAGRLSVLFCGINPGMAAAAAGHHFEGRANRFWRVLHLAGFTPDELSPQEDRRILDYGCGLTTIVGRPTAAAGDLSRQDFVDAASGFERKIAAYAPRFVAFLGKAAYAALTGERDIAWGRQAVAMHDSTVWVLPNPSGRNRSFTLERLVGVYRPLHVGAASAAMADLVARTYRR